MLKQVLVPDNLIWMIVKPLLLVVFLFIFVGCGPLHRPSYTGPASFEGPGTYRPQGDEQSPASNSPMRSSSAFYLTPPVDQVRLTQEFRPSHNPKHQGVDFGGRRGMPIRAAHEGVVIYAGQDFSGYGKMVMIEFSETWATLYAHLDRIQVKEGKVVQQGDVIGTMGRTGRATGVHLHFELMKKKNPVDPLPFFSSEGSRLSQF